ncbi:MAG: hypothetical protein PWP65_1538 [Clostridia bacterium]|nr:hypothetical protein [Clostridia bacterium]
MGEQFLKEGFSMDKIKTALEIALERANAIKVDSEKLLELDYVPQGKVLGARFLSNNNFNLEEELRKFGPEARPYVLRGLEDTFLSNLSLPRDEVSMQANRRCMEGLKLIKKNKAALKQVFQEIETLFQYYARALEQTYVNLKEDFAARLLQAQRALGRQLGMRVNIDVERQPEFQEEWSRLRGQLSAQYENILEEKRRYIRSLN